MNCYSNKQHHIIAMMSNCRSPRAGRALRNDSSENQDIELSGNEISQKWLTMQYPRGSKDDSSQYPQVLRNDSSRDLGVQRDHYPQDLEVLRGDSSRDLGVQRDHYPQDLEVLRDDSSRDLGVQRDHYPQDLEVLRDDSSRDLGVQRDHYPQDLEVLRDDSSRDLGVQRDHYPQDLEVLRDYNADDLGLLRDDNPHDPQVLRSSSFQDPVVQRDDSLQDLRVLRDGSSQDPEMLGDGSSHDPQILRGDSSQSPNPHKFTDGVSKDDSSQGLQVLKDDILGDSSSLDPYVLREKTSQGACVLRDGSLQEQGMMRDDSSNSVRYPRALRGDSSQNTIVSRHEITESGTFGGECLKGYHKKKEGRSNVQHIRDRNKNKSILTAVFIKFAEPLREDFDTAGYISNRISRGIEFTVTDRTFEQETKNTIISLLCSSKHAASRLKVELEKENHRSPTKILCFDTLQEARGYGMRSWKAIEESCEIHTRRMSQRSKATLGAHYTRITDVKSRLKSIRSSNRKYMSVEVYETRCSEIRALEDKEKELNLQGEEFLNYLKNALSQLKEAKESKDFEKIAVQARLNLAVECNRLRNAFPIYARRSDILCTVRNNQVSIIIGETGSGKSTQMAQYFYQAGLANDGIIVCTQPRKIAATSLAVHVAKELGTSVGEIVGYKVGMQVRKSSVTKVLYMTDHILLNECLKDRNFSAYSCIIVDEAHERSIYTDLLLGLIKDCLQKRPKLRVVITSATINPETFVRYFKQCPVLFVSGRMFPVEVEWKEPVIGVDSFDNYEEQCVRKAIAVHHSEGEGDILVFVTSALETENCCGKFRDLMEGKQENYITLPLHGRLQGDEQQKVFDPAPAGKRKIVFATNSAETSVTIPGVKYVIDTGLVKEMKFDPIRKISTLAVTMVSQSSAKQRLGRAGRLGPGKCYRLYTHDDFCKMDVDALPEILRIHIGHAVLKLMELGVDPLRFQFIKSPPEEAMLEAFSSLVAVGAVVNETITERGKWIAKMPFDPRYGAFVYDAVQSGAGLEAIIIAAGSRSGSIFFRGGSAEDKEKADKLKVQFCHEGGDQLTLLNVFREWQKVPEREKGRWCYNHSVNAKLVKSVRVTSNEVLHKLKMEMNVQIKFSFGSPEAVDGLLAGLLFKALNRNLSYYLGHSKAGYNAVFKEQRVEIHPSSALLSLANQPKWIVFDQVMRTSRYFAIQVTPVPESMVVKGNEDGWLLVKTEEVKKDQIIVTHQEYVGTQMFREFVGPRYIELRNLESRLALKCPGSVVIVEANRDNGELQVLSNEKFKNSLGDSLSQIAYLRSKFEQEESEECLGSKAIDASVRAVIGTGGCTVKIFMPDEYSAVMINCTEEMVDKISEADVLENFGQYGKIKEVKKFFQKQKLSTRWGKVFYEKTESAIYAVRATKNCLELKAIPGCRFPVQAINGFRTKICWCRRPSKGFGFVEFANVEDYLRAVLLISILVGGSLSRINRARNSTQSVHVSGFNKLVAEDVLRDAFAGTLNIDPEKDIVRVIVVREKVKLNKEILNTTRRRLLHKLEEFAEPNTFHLDLREPRSENDIRFTAFCVFNNPEEGHRACTEINRGFLLNGESVTMKADLYSSVFIHKNVYKKCGEELLKQIDDMENDKKEVRIKLKHLKNENVIVELHTENVNILARTRAAIQKFIRGDTMECENNQTTLSLFTREGRKVLQAIMDKSGTLIVTDDRVLTVSIHGLQTNRRMARVLLDDYLEQVSHGNFKNVELKGGGKPPGVMKTLMLRFGIDLGGLQAETGLSAVKLNHRNHQLRMMGTEDAIDKAFNIVSEVINGLTNDGVITEKDDDPDCVTCFCPVELNNIYRLESCGHPYCRECIQLQLNTAINNKDFPIVCEKEECSSKFVWRDFVNLSCEGLITLGKLVNASVSTFVSQHKDEFHYCTTPDCPTVYGITKTGTPFMCPECCLKICTSCHIQYHDGLSCAMYKSMKDDDSVSQWLRNDTENRKRCTHCTTPIEKIEGCNKMHCLGCKKFICWRCMAFFDSEQECYGHLQKEHGTFY